MLIYLTVLCYINICKPIYFSPSENVLILVELNLHLTFSIATV